MSSAGNEFDPWRWWGAELNAFRHASCGVGAWLPRRGSELVPPRLCVAVADAQASEFVRRLMTADCGEPMRLRASTPAVRVEDGLIGEIAFGVTELDFVLCDRPHGSPAVFESNGALRVEWPEHLKSRLVGRIAHNAVYRDAFDAEPFDAEFLLESTGTVGAGTIEIWPWLGEHGLIRP